MNTETLALNQTDMQQVESFASHALRHAAPEDLRFITLYTRVQADPRLRVSAALYADFLTALNRALCRSTYCLYVRDWCDPIYLSAFEDAIARRITAGTR